VRLVPKVTLTVLLPEDSPPAVVYDVTRKVTGTPLAIAQVFRFAERVVAGAAASTNVLLSLRYTRYFSAVGTASQANRTMLLFSNPVHRKLVGAAGGVTSFTVTWNDRLTRGVDQPVGCCAPRRLMVTVPLTAVVDDVTFTHRLWSGEVGVVSTATEAVVALAQLVPTVAVVPAGVVAMVAVIRCWRFLPAEVSSRTNDVSAVEVLTLSTDTAPGEVAVKLMLPAVAP
jgi:hypothetical protein